MTRMRSMLPAECVAAETHGIRCEVRVALALSHSEFTHHLALLFVYRVTLIGLDDARVGQLTHRSWIIDNAGRQETVNGPGVIGLYPKVSPGSHFSYESCCRIQSDVQPGGVQVGSMRGSLKFRASNGTTFEIEVPRFSFFASHVMHFDE